MTDDPICIGWIAGFLDGEGYFSIYARGSAGSGKGYDHKPRALVRVNQAGTREPLEKLQATLGGSIHEASRKTATGKRVWGWQWQSAAGMREYLPLLIPHMTVKRHEAELVLRFAKLIRTRSDARPLTEDDLAERSAIAGELLACRKGGPNHRP